MHGLPANTNEQHLPASTCLLSCSEEEGKRSKQAGNQPRQPMKNSTSPPVDWGDDSAGEMDSEDAAAAASMGIVGIASMMEVDADDRHPPSAASTLSIDADFFNAFQDDFDDQDLD
ncbi:hypothetical protein HU200_011832 [Digitaria exilis]|uniref:Uncharacterized protein n=1 Tax=Digitaria exilis TaxID=1010633 RepID=A0A835FHD5_9POAL|nr:hypothetical protein HU200_011832 [Digitaria exilis]